MLSVTDPANPVFGSKAVGSRAATRVKVVREGAFLGKRGTVVRVVHPSNVMVRLDGAGMELSFGPSELERINA